MPYQAYNANDADLPLCATSKPSAARATTADSRAPAASAYARPMTFDDYMTFNANNPAMHGRIPDHQTAFADPSKGAVIGDVSGQQKELDSAINSANPNNVANAPANPAAGQTPFQGFGAPGSNGFGSQGGGFGSPNGGFGSSTGGFGSSTGGFGSAYGGGGTAAPAGAANALPPQPPPATPPPAANPNDNSPIR
jgi:hypothetical protein